MSALAATDQIIKEVCLKMDDNAFLCYDKVMAGVLDAIADLNLYGIPTFSHVILNLNAYNAVDWPCSLVKPILTCLLRDDKLILLDVDDNIMNTFPVSAEATNIAEADEEINDLFGIDGNWLPWSNGFNWGLGEVYALKSGYSYLGYVTHDKKLRQSFIKGQNLKSTDQIVIFFKSTGLDECPKFVPAETKTAVIHYALYSFYMIRDPKLSELSLKNYKENFTRINKYSNSDPESAWISAMSSNVMSSPKGF